MMKVLASPEYKAMWGHSEKRQVLGHPKRVARRERALTRQAEESTRSTNDPRRKSVRLGRASAA